MGNIGNLLGLKVNYLTVIEFAGTTKDSKSKWKCRCICGNETIVTAANLLKKVRPTQSCGCQKGNRVYGPVMLRRDHHLILTKEKSVWLSMIKRCNTKNGPQAKDYYGRGIKVKFKDFEEFFAEVGEHPGGDYSIGRIDNDGHYEPGKRSLGDKETTAEQHKG